MNFIGYIKFIHNAFSALNRIRINERKDIELEPGWYYIAVGTRAILYNRNVSKSFLTMLGVDVSKPSLLCRYVGKKRSNPIYTAQLLMSTNDGIRYFNSNDCTTWHKFSDTREYNQYNKSLKCFVPPFRSTALIIREEYCIEKLIDHIPRKSWEKDEQKRRFYDVFEKYIKYLRKSPIEERVVKVKSNCPVIVSDKYNNLLNKLIKEIEPYRFTKYVFTHGDLHFENVLFDNDEAFLLDFEMADDNVFFYDIFNLIYVEYIDKDSEFLINAYLSKDAEMMNYFGKLFKAVGDNYDVNLANKYFKLFLLERITRTVSRLVGTYCEKEIIARIEKNVFKINKVLNKIYEYEI